MRTIILFLAFIYFTSCEKCVQCTTTISYHANISSSMIPKGTTSTQEYCGTTKEIRDYQKAGTINTISYVGTVKMTQKTETICK